MPTIAATCGSGGITTCSLAEPFDINCTLNVVGLRSQPIPDSSNAPILLHN